MLDLRASDRAITAAMVRDYGETRREIRADLFVLACGGIENSRLLLWMNERTNGKIVKNATALGRYWMDHPHYDLGHVVVFHSPDRAYQNNSWPPHFYAFYAVQDRLKHEMGLLNAGLRIRYNFRITPYDIKKPFVNLACQAPRLRKLILTILDKKQACLAKLISAWEQEPRYINRIALSRTKRDKFGVPRSVLHLHKSDRDLRTARESAILLGKHLIRKGLGRMQLDEWVFGRGDYPTDSEICGPHHLGGTRMGTDPNLSVVDADCKVHGQDNLYIGGSSVFPSGGHANPTLSIVQFALRLADRLEARLDAQGR